MPSPFLISSVLKCVYHSPACPKTRKEWCCHTQLQRGLEMQSFIRTPTGSASWCNSISETHSVWLGRNAVALPPTAIAQRSLGYVLSSVGASTIWSTLHGLSHLTVSETSQGKNDYFPGSKTRKVRQTMLPRPKKEALCPWPSTPTDRLPISSSLQFQRMLLSFMLMSWHSEQDEGPFPQTGCHGLWTHHVLQQDPQTTLFLCTDPKITSPL